MWRFERKKNPDANSTGEFDEISLYEKKAVS
jgi:hypothetical protein